MRSKPSELNFNEPPEIKSILEEKFGLILNDEELPNDLKGEVFSSINSLVLMGDLADLFTVKFAQTSINYISPFDNKYEE